MGKDFFEVFPTLNLPEDVRFLLKDVRVTKVATNSTRDFIRIYLFSTHLLQKKKIYELEYSIKHQLFDRSSIQVEILESYQLSGQYTPENLMNEYYESILLELEQRSAVERSMFEHADCEFEDGVLNLKLQNSIVAEGKKDSIVNLLLEVFNNRFHVPLSVKVGYLPPKKKSALEFNDLLLQAEVDEIIERNEALRKEKQKKAGESENGGNDSGKEKSPPVPKMPKEKRFGKEMKKPIMRRDFRKSDDPNMIYGRDFDDTPIELSQVVGEMGEITIRGKVISFDTREIRNEKTILMFAVTDFTDTITVKMFARNDQLPDLLGDIKKGSFLKVKGITTIDKFDGELTIGSVTGIRKIHDFTVSRKDLYPEKRVELHCHTKMSDMDGVSEVNDIVKRAHDWGHKAIAITDHGVVQAFPDANHFIQSLDKEDPFKIIYGVEAYLVDDLTEIAPGAGSQSLDGTYVVFDLETTGFSPIQDKIIEIGAVKVERGVITERFSTFVNPKIPIPFKITQLTSITDDMVVDAETIDVVLPKFLDFIGDAVLVAHNAGFDVSFIEQNCRYQEIEREFISLDTVALARVLLPTLSKYKLNVVAKALNISLENHHRAVDDAGATAEIFVRFVEMLKEREIDTLKELNQFGSMNPDAIRKLPSHHAVILAKNETGRVNLYRLVSMSHLQYFSRMPRIPKSEFLRYREGLIIGSACEAGELFQAVLNGKSEEQIAKLVDFYDYLEIQPIGNNRFMIASDRVSNVRSEEDLRDLNRKIVRLGEKFQKPVVVPKAGGGDLRCAFSRSGRRGVPENYYGRKRIY